MAAAGTVQVSAAPGSASSARPDSTDITMETIAGSADELACLQRAGCRVSHGSAGRPPVLEHDGDPVLRCGQLAASKGVIAATFASSAVQSIPDITLRASEHEDLVVPMSGLLARDPEAQLRLTARVLAHGYAVIRHSEAEYEHIAQLWDALGRLMRLDEASKFSMMGDDCGYVDGGIFEQFQFRYQEGLGDDAAEARRGEWPSIRDLSAGQEEGEPVVPSRTPAHMRGETRQKDVPGCAGPKYPWPPGDEGLAGHLPGEPGVWSFRMAACEYWGRQARHGREVLRGLAQGLGVKPAELLGLVDDPDCMLEGEASNADMRLFHYRNRSGEQGDMRDWGEAHVDIGLLTMIPLGGRGIQLCEGSAPGSKRAPSPPGLKMLDKARGLWVSIEESACPGDMVVFPSDVFRVLFGGMLGGTVHRVHRPTGTATERYSIPLIIRPKDGAMVRTIPGGPMGERLRRLHGSAAAGERPGAGAADPGSHATGASAGAAGDGVKGEPAAGEDRSGDYALYPSYSPHFRLAALKHVLPSTADFAYLPKDWASAKARADRHAAGKPLWEKSS